MKVRSKRRASNLFASFRFLSNRIVREIFPCPCAKGSCRSYVFHLCCLATSPGWVDAQLTKNCGIVLLLFQKMYDFQAIMAGGDSGPYPSHDRYLPEVEMDFIADPDGPDVVRYIEERAADIDVLVLHGPQEYYYAAPLERYRVLRPDGRVYLELDSKYFSAFNSSSCREIGRASCRVRV